MFLLQRHQVNIFCSRGMTCFRRWQSVGKIIFFAILLTLALPCHAEKMGERVTIDRLQLAVQQIDLLKVRLNQGDQELIKLQHQHDQAIPSLSFDKINKDLLDKTSLEISVSKPNLDSINIELDDSRQTVNWLEKNVQE